MKPEEQPKPQLNDPAIVDPATEVPGVDNQSPEADRSSKSDSEASEQNQSGVPLYISQKEEKKEPKKKGLSPLKIFKIYIFPIVTLLSFFGIIIFLIIPGMQNMFGGFEEMGVISEEIIDLERELGRLQQLDDRYSDVLEDLAALNRIVPTGITEVTDFQDRIVKLAISRGLKVREAESVSQSLQTSEEGIKALGIIEVPSHITIQGSLSGIKEFINDINGIDDFVIVGEMKLKNQSTNDGDQTNWSLDLLLLKYQFQVPDEDNKLEEIYSRVPPNSQPNADVLELIRR